MTEYKICTGTRSLDGCGETKPITDFHVNKNRRTNMCTACTSAHKRGRYAANRDDRTMSELEKLALCSPW